jgi:hypothetical protein
MGLGLDEGQIPSLLRRQRILTSRRQLARRKGIGIRFESLVLRGLGRSLRFVRLDKSRICCCGWRFGREIDDREFHRLFLHGSRARKSSPKSGKGQRHHEVEKKRGQNRPQDFRFLS